MKKLQKEYKVGDRTFVYDKKSLSQSFDTYSSYTDIEFLENIIDILHYAVYACWVKEISSDDCLADDGIVHELVHLLQKNTIGHSNLKQIRKKFNETLIF